MELIDHTLAWSRGEIFEGNMALLYGLVVGVVSLAFWKYSHTPYAKGIISPLATVAILFISTGIYLNIQNHNRIPDYQKSYEANAGEFAQGEKIRTEEFIKWYTVTRYTMAGFIILGLVSLLFMASPSWKGAGIGLILLGFSVIFLDHFSEERVEVYHANIMESIVKTDVRR